MKPFIIKTIQLRDLTLEELQQVWDKLIAIEGTQIHETLKDLDPKNPNSCDIKYFDYLGISVSSNSTTFTSYRSKLQGEIVDINKVLEIPAYMSILVDKMPHVHEKLIKEWAEGAQIQSFNDGKWEDCFPLWNEYVQYRVKPRGRFISTIRLENTGEYTSNELKVIIDKYYPEAEITLEKDEQEILLKFNKIINLEEILGKLSKVYIKFKESNVTFN